MFVGILFLGILLLTKESKGSSDVTGFLLIITTPLHDQGAVLHVNLNAYQMGGCYFPIT